MTTTILLVVLVLVGCGGGAGGPPDETGEAGSSGAGTAGAASPTGSGGTNAAGGATGASGAGAAGSAGPVVELVRQALSGSRLKAYWYTGADGAKQFAGKWYDSMLKLDCSMSADPTGKQRCLPVAAGALPYFSDAGCSTRLAGVSKTIASCPAYGPAGAPSFVAVADSKSCPMAMNRVGGAHAGAVYQGTPAACTPVPTVVTDIYDFYLIGSTVDLSMFAEVATAHD